MNRRKKPIIQRERRVSAVIKGGGLGWAGPRDAIQPILENVTPAPGNCHLSAIKADTVMYRVRDAVCLGGRTANNANKEYEWASSAAGSFGSPTIGRGTRYGPDKRERKGREGGERWNKNATNEIAVQKGVKEEGLENDEREREK